MESEWMGWHFLPEDRRLRYRDCRKVRVGETLTCAGPLVLCGRGMHASAKAIDALNYAPGPIVCRVRLSGEILAPEGEDKACATERTVLAMTDATRVLQEWMLWCAERVLPLFEAQYPGDKRPRLALEAKRKWMDGEITDGELDATSAAAWGAAAAAASAAASAAAWAAASAAASAAAWDAATATARDVAWDAATATATARDEMNEELERRLLDLLGIGES